jgi:heptosyltransferase-1
VKILIVKTSALGDIVHAYRVLHYLVERFPGVEVDWVVEERCRELVENHPQVSRTIVIDSRKGRRHPFAALASLKRELAGTHYDCLFDLQGNIKSALITWMARAKVKVGFGRKSVAEWPNLCVTNKRWDPPVGQNIRDDYLFLAQAHFSDTKPFDDPSVQLSISEEEKLEIDALLNGRPTLLVCPGSNWRNKRLPNGKLKAFLSRYRDHDLLLAWGSEEEERRVRALGIGRLLPKVSLPALHYLMSKVNLVVAMDSLPLHLAGTTSTPTVAFFGSSSLEKYNPTGSQNSAYQGACPYNRTFEKRCPILRSCPTGSCIRDLTA